jgi:hypothetical protein
MPVEGIGKRTEPLDFTNDHGRYIAVSPERGGVSIRGLPLNLAAAFI